MGTELKEVSASGELKSVGVNSYSGGDKGRCLQLTQGTISAEIIQMTRSQVRQFIATAQEWLNETANMPDSEYDKRVEALNEAMDDLAEEAGISRESVEESVNNC